MDFSRPFRPVGGAAFDKLRPRGWRRYLGREHGVEDRDQPPSPHGFRLRYNFGETSRCAKEVGGWRTAGSWQPRDKLPATSSGQAGQADSRQKELVSSKQDK